MISRRLYQLLVTATFTISAMIYYRTAIDVISNNSESSEVSYWNTIYLAGLAFFAGMFEASEVYDHLFPKQIDVDASESDRIQASTSANSVQKSLLVATSTAILSPPLLLCAWAHKLQGDELARSLGVDSRLLGLVLATPQLAKFFAVSLPHLFHTLNGTREKFSLSVTNNKNVQISQSTIPPLKWWIMLSLLIYLHMPEGMLISSPIRNQALKKLAAFGFAFAESLPHINQLEQLPHNITKMLKEDGGVTKTALALRLGAGMLGGLGSASEALMAAFVGTRSRATAWIAPLFEFVLGFAETQQHLVPSIEAAAKNLTFFRPKKNPVNQMDTGALHLSKM